MRRALKIYALVLLGVFACSDGIDWSGVGYYCDSARPCMHGYTCKANRCIPNDMDASDVGQINDQDDDRANPGPFVPKIAFMCSGTTGDYGWTWTFHQAGEAIKSSGYSVTYAFSVNPADTDSQVQQFIKSGYNVIIGTDHSFLTPMLSVASKYPNDRFLVCGGFQSSSNTGSFYGRMYQITWLAGMAAGVVTKTGKTGVISTFPTPDNIRQINAFALGARKINPKVEVVVIFTNSTNDSKKERDDTRKLLDLDCDVIFAHTFSAASVQYIENKGNEPLQTEDGHRVYTIAYGTDSACKNATRTCLGAPTWNWAPMITRILKKMQENQWKGDEIVWEQVKNDASSSGLYMAPLELANQVIPSEYLSQIEANIAALAKSGKTGSMLPFKGPVKDNTDKTRVSSGKYPDDKLLLRMCWFVKGVVDKDGNPATVPGSCIGDH